MRLIALIITLAIIVVMVYLTLKYEWFGLGQPAPGTSIEQMQEGNVPAQRALEGAQEIQKKSDEATKERNKMGNE